MENYIFLDIDGVLNDVSTTEKAPSGYTGIDDSKIELLTLLVDAFNAKIILTSDWKRGWEPDYNDCDDDMKYIINKLKLYGLTIYDKTKEKRGSYYRGEGINTWLSEHPNVGKYIILDDNEFEFGLYQNIKSHAIITLDGIQWADAYDEDYCDDVKQAIKIIRNHVDYEEDESTICKIKEV